jgi:hypothetical protein
MQRTLNLIELGGFIINIAHIAYIQQGDNQISIVFNGAPPVQLEGKDAERLLQLIRSYQIPIS